MIISEALAKFFGTGEKEMLQSEALGRVWEYIKANQLEVSGPWPYEYIHTSSGVVCFINLLGLHIYYLI